MPPGLNALTLAQVGVEGTKGTAVAATEKLIGEFSIIPDRERYISPYPRAVRVESDGGGTLIRDGVIVNMTSELDYEQVMYAFCGVDQPATSGVGPYVHAYDPTLTGAHTYDTLTFEFAIDDGTTKQEQVEAAYCVPQSFEIAWVGGAMATFRATWFGRAMADTTVTAALTEMNNRSLIPGSLFTVDLDTTWAGLGTTQLATTVRRCTLQVNTGLVAQYTSDGRSALDFPGVSDGMFSGTLRLQVLANANFETEYDAFLAGTLRFIRLEATDGTKILQINMAVRWTSPPSYTVEDGQVLANFEGAFVWDTTGTEVFTISLTNQISAFA